MSLYARLLALSDRTVRTEDVLTEVVAHLLRLDAALRPPDEALVVRWLGAIGALGPGAVGSVRIDTQRAYPALGPGEPSNRPDLVVEVERVEGPPDVVFVESKVGSGEGDGQLDRYARTLAASHGAAGRRALVYLTRDPDPKDPGAVLSGADGVAFVPARWHRVYREARSARESAPSALGSLYDDVLSFLTHLGMDHDPRFTPADALALGRIPRTIRFLDSTLWDGAPPPSDRFRELLDGVNQRDAGLARIRDHSRYTLYRKEPGGSGTAQFEVLLGYLFDDDAFPRLVLEVGALPSDGGSGAVAEAVRSLGGRGVPGTGWTWEAYDAPEANWCGARVAVPVGPLLGGPDDAAALRRALHVLLDELARVRTEGPADLPWAAPGAATQSG